MNWVSFKPFNEIDIFHQPFGKLNLTIQLLKEVLRLLYHTMDLESLNFNNLSICYHHTGRTLFHNCRNYVRHLKSY